MSNCITDNNKRIKQKFWGAEQRIPVAAFVLRKAGEPGTLGEMAKARESKPRGASPLSMTAPGGRSITKKVDLISHSNSEDHIRCVMICSEESDKFFGLNMCADEHIDEIISHTATVFSLTEDAIVKKRGKRVESLARKVVYWRIRRECGLSYEVIARVFLTQHTTVMHGINHLVRHVLRVEA